jgi:hypothetical protein
VHGDHELEVVRARRVVVVVGGARGAWELPVKVDAVEAVVAQELRHAVLKGAAVDGHDGVLEALERCRLGALGPAANGDDLLVGAGRGQELVKLLLHVVAQVQPKVLVEAGKRKVQVCQVGRLAGQRRGVHGEAGPAGVEGLKVADVGKGGRRLAVVHNVRTTVGYASILTDRV